MQYLLTSRPNDDHVPLYPTYLALPGSCRSLITRDQRWPTVLYHVSRYIALECDAWRCMPIPTRNAS
eukprot:scaffold107982_cov24-Tisochrysis_lutea.AAC.2